MKIYTTKTTYQISEVVGNLCKDKDPLKSTIVFCEDKFTLQLELSIAKSCGGTFGTNVFSFNRFMHKNLPVSKKVLSPEGCVLVVKDVLLQQKKQLLCFKNVYDPNLASTVYELIAQLKSAKVTPLDIERAVNETSGNLNRKLKDIYLIFSEYEKYIELNNLTDGNNRLSMLPCFFEEDENIKNTDVIVAGFPSLNRTLADIFKSLAKNAKSLTFVVTAGENRGVYTNETFNFVMKEFSPEHIKVDCNGIVDHMLNGLYRPSSKGENGIYSNKIHIYRAKTVEEELEHIAGIIKRGVINGARYKDYAICSEDIAPYELLLKRIFADFDIPLFCDTSKDLGKHPLTRLVCEYIDMVRRNFDPEDVLAFAKNPLFIAEKSVSDGFENYFIKCGINRKTVSEDFSVYDENLQLYEKIRKKIIEVSQYVSEKMTFAQVVEGISKMLERVNAFKNLSLLNDMLSSENSADLISINAQVKDKFDGIIVDAVSILGEKVLPLKEVKNIILTGMTSSKVSVILESGDCVFAGDFRGIRYQRNKNLFAIGMTDGIPSSKLDSALLCDRDIAKMEKSAVLVEPKIKEVNRRAREACCMALASFDDGLYLSFPVVGLDGGDVVCSDIISYIISLFSSENEQKYTKIYDSDIFEREAENLGKTREKSYKTRKYLSERTALFAFAKDISDFKEGGKCDFSSAASYYKYIKDSNSGKTASSILNACNAEIGYYKDDVNYVDDSVSATTIEGYFDCPYKNFLSKGVKLKEREEGKIKVNDLGTMFHDVAERFVKKVEWDYTEEQVLSLVHEIFEEVSADKQYLRYTKSQQGKKAFEIIETELQRFCMQIFNGCIHSQLKPKYVEVSFGKGEHPIEIPTEDGLIEIKGKIDRIDANDEYMRIIDYKTGHVDDKIDKSFYMGKKLQLYLYAQAFSADYQPIGAYYFPVSSDFSEKGDGETMKLQGKTIEDTEKAKIIDDTISDSNVHGTYVNTNLKISQKTGGFSYPQTLLSQKEFESYMDYSVKVSSEGIKEMKKGVIIPSPTPQSCTYCKYKGLCGYDEAVDQRTRDFGKIKKQNIICALLGKEQAEVEDDEDGNN